MGVLSLDEVSGTLTSQLTTAGLEPPCGGRCTVPGQAGPAGTLSHLKNPGATGASGNAGIAGFAGNACVPGNTVKASLAVNGGKAWLPGIGGVASKLGIDGFAGNAANGSKKPLAGFACICDVAGRQ